MEKSSALSNMHCLNCGTSIKGEVCHRCGQHVRDNSDRSLGPLLGEFFRNVFFLDNRFFLSLWYLVRFPGRMTVEFLKGKRKKFISPVTLFLFLNLIYFFVNPLSDYSLSLEDQAYSQPYSQWTVGWIEHKLQKEGLDFQNYAITYQNTSDSIAKSIMIINVPMIAFFVFLMGFKRRRFYFDYLIFAFHFFSIFMASWIMVLWADNLIALIISHYDSIVASISFYLFAFVIPLIYGIISIKKFMDLRWYWAILAGLGIMIAVTLASLFYRFIILSVTLGVT